MIADTVGRQLKVTLARGSLAPRRKKGVQTMSDLEQPSLFEDLKDIWSKATLLAFFFALPALTLSAIVTLALEPINPLLTVIFGTWPLVASATILIMMMLRRSFTGMSDANKLYAIGACLVVPYLIAYFFGATGYGDLRGETTRSWIQLLHPAHLLMLVINIVVYYLSAFGIVRTAASIVCGGFLAWAFQIKLLPHVRCLTVKG
jgi:hypothetical protein